MNKHKIVTRVAPLAGLLAMSACAERADVQAPTTDVRSTANAAADRLVDLSKGEDATPEDWFALAATARESADYATAAEALDMAATDLPPVRVSLERARLSAAQGRQEEAVATLQALVDGGFTAVRLVEDDAAFESLRGVGEYDALLDVMTRRAYPCEHDPDFAAFDFWLGSWEVHTSSGQLAGTNRIERAERGCVLTEYWTNTAGGTGMSVNYVDKSTDEWVQIWNSQDGTQIQVRGGPTTQGMALEGTIHYVATGTTAPFRGLWSPLEDGRVRQYFEQSNDDGEWTPWFEGFYTRQAQSDSQEESQ